MSKHGNIPIPNRLYMMKKNQGSTTEEEKAVFFGNQECPEIMEQITLYQDDRLAIVEDIHNLNQDYTARIEAFIALLCQQGKGSVYIDDQQYEVKENDLLICHPNIILERGMISVDFKCCGFCLSPEYVRQIGVLSAESWDAKLFIEKHPIIPLVPREAILFQQYYDLLRSKLTAPPCKHQKELINSLLQAFMYEFHDTMERYIKVTSPSYTSGEKLFNSFIAQLSSSYPKKRSVTYYADKLAVSPKYLSAICKEISEKTASELINQYVVKDIEYQLKRSIKSIKEIANELDFPNISFFGKYVKRYLGVSPKQYRAALD